MLLASLLQLAYFGKNGRAPSMLNAAHMAMSSSDLARGLIFSGQATVRYAIYG